MRTPPLTSLGNLSEPGPRHPRQFGNFSNWGHEFPDEKSGPGRASGIEESAMAAALSLAPWSSSRSHKLHIVSLIVTLACSLHRQLFLRLAARVVP